MNILAFGVPGPTDWMVILIIVLVLFGAKKVPELFKGMAQGVNEFRKAREEFEREMHAAGSEVKQAANMTQPSQPTQAYQPAQNAAQPYQPSPNYPPQPVTPGVQPPVASAPVYQQPPTQPQPQQPVVQPQPDNRENRPA